MKVAGALGVIAISLASGTIGAAINERYFSDAAKDAQSFTVADAARRRVTDAMQAILETAILREKLKRELVILRPEKEQADRHFEDEEWDAARTGYNAILASLRKHCPRGLPECGGLGERPSGIPDLPLDPVPD